MGELTPFLLLAGLVFLTFRRWITLPLGLFLAVVWLSAGGILVAVVPFGATVALAEAALWCELQELLMGSGPLPPRAEREAAFHGMVGGLLGGVAVLVATGVPGAPLALGFAGALASGLATGRDGLRATGAALSLPGMGRQATIVHLLMGGAVLAEVLRSLGSA